MLNPLLAYLVLILKQINIFIKPQKIPNFIAKQQID